MESTSRHSWRTRHKLSIAVRRRIAAVCVIISFAVIAVETALHARIVFDIAPFLGVVCGLEYLRATHRWPR